MSTLGRQARLLVHPAPRTLGDTTAILARLQSFGKINAFLNPRYVPHLRAAQDLKPESPHTIELIFDSAKSLETALAASPLTIPINQPSPSADPKETDPFNIRGLQSRKYPHPKTFICKIIPDPDPERHASIARANPFYGRFDVDTMQPAFSDLRKQAIPSPGMAVPLSRTNRGYVQRQDQVKQIDVNDAGLMGMYRDALQKRRNNSAELQSAKKERQPVEQEVSAELRETVWKPYAEGMSLDENDMRQKSKGPS